MGPVASQDLCFFHPLFQSGLGQKSNFVPFLRRVSNGHCVVVIRVM